MKYPQSVPVVLVYVFVCVAHANHTLFVSLVSFVKMINYDIYLNTQEAKQSKSKTRLRQCTPQYGISASLMSMPNLVEPPEIQKRPPCLICPDAQPCMVGIPTDYMPIDAFPWGAWPRDAAVDTHRQAGRQSTALTGASLCSCHETKRFRILATLKQGNKSMYSNTSAYVHMRLRLD